MEMQIINRFKKFGGEHIPDIIEYLRDYIKRDPGITITVGCDSIQRRRRTIFAVTIMIYSVDYKNGAHVIFFRENLLKIRDHFERLSKEAEMAIAVADILNDQLSSFYERKDLSEIQRKRYKFHIARSNGEYPNISNLNVDNVIKNITLNDSEKTFEYKLVDIHLDFNPNEGTVDKKGVAKNKSNLNYKTYIPYIRSLGYRVYAKSEAHAASSAADLLLQD